jgi:hypothetical protein
MKVEDQLALILTKLDEQTKGINEGNRRINEVQVSTKDLKAAKDNFEQWRPQVDSKVADLRSCVDSLRNQVVELRSASPKLKNVIADDHVYTKSSGSTHLDPFLSGAAQGLLGHGGESRHRGSGSGSDAPSNHLRSKVSPKHP